MFDIQICSITLCFVNSLSNPHLELSELLKGCKYYKFALNNRILTFILFYLYCVYTIRNYLQIIYYIVGMANPWHLKN